VKPNCWAAELAVVADAEWLPWALLALGVVLALGVLALLPAPRGGDEAEGLEAEKEIRETYASRALRERRHRRERRREYRGASKPWGEQPSSPTGIRKGRDG
jgi:hypothetical protein